MNLGQFYHVSYDMASPYLVCGGLQDNNTWCGPSAVRSRGGIGNDEWFIIGGGDGFVALVDPKDPRVMYSESQNGRMNRVDRVTNERQSIRPEPAAGRAQAPLELGYSDDALAPRSGDDFRRREQALPVARSRVRRGRR